MPTTDDSIQTAATGPAGFALDPLPDDLLALLRDVGAPPRLVAHLRLVRDTARQIIAGVGAGFPALEFDPDAILFGASTHDIGKALHPNELTGPGKEHEAAGERLLLDRGYSAELAHFARWHSTWDRPETTIEDLMVSLADAVWKGVRWTDLESVAVDAIGVAVGMETWEVFMGMDDVLTPIADGGVERLAFQGLFGVLGDPARGTDTRKPRPQGPGWISSYEPPRV